MRNGMKGQGNLKLPKLHRWTVLLAKVSTLLRYMLVIRLKTM